MSSRSFARSGAVAALVDAGPLFANADADDDAHERSHAALMRTPGPLLVPDLVVAEVAYLVGTRLGGRAEVRFIGSLAAGDVIVEHVTAADLLRIAELVARYHDLPLGTVDAALVAIAERLRISTVITLDEHFRVVRPAHVDAFTIVP